MTCLSTCTCHTCLMVYVFTACSTSCASFKSWGISFSAQILVGWSGGGLPFSVPAFLLSHLPMLSSLRDRRRCVHPQRAMDPQRDHPAPSHRSTLVLVAFVCFVCVSFDDGHGFKVKSPKKGGRIKLNFQFLNCVLVFAVP